MRQRKQNPELVNLFHAKHGKKHNVCPDCRCYEREGKTCSSCHVSKPVEQFRAKPDGYLQSYCLDCEPQIIGKYAQKYADKRKKEKLELIALRKENKKLKQKLDKQS